MYSIRPNNTIIIGGYSIPFDLFAEACKVLVAREDEGSGVIETPSFIVFRGIGVVRKELVWKASRSISFKELRRS